jgi:HAD superfamily hydrolase (TIGR01509 family)
MGLPRDVWAEADRRWLDLYAEQPAQLLTEARPALARVAAAGIPTGLVTSGQRERVAADLDRLGLAGAFQSIVCGSDLPQRKPDPAPLRRGLADLGAATSDAAYIGDSPEDILMARAAGVRAVAVPGGYPNRPELIAAGADIFAETLGAALSALEID